MSTPDDAEAAAPPIEEVEERSAEAPIEEVEEQSAEAPVEEVEEQSAEAPVERPPPPVVPGNTKAAPNMGAETVERFGHPVRHFPVAVSAEAMALAWANREDAPAGATVVVDREVGARGLHGRLWEVPFEDSLSCAVVLRPALSVEESNVTWLVASLAALQGAEALTGRTLGTWWPDQIVDPESGDEVGAVRAEIQLGPGKVKCAVASIRLDLSRLDLTGGQRDEALEAVVRASDAAAELLGEGAEAVAKAYQERCQLLGKRVKIQLRPKGETRGTARRIDHIGRLEIESTTGMVERIGVDQLRSLVVV